MRIVLIFPVFIMMVGCTTTKYSDNTYYYKKDGVVWSCREPKPYKGGNCKIDSTWPDGGLNG